MDGRARSATFWVATAVVLATANWLILQKETTRHDGRTVLLRLTPRDPRSLIQGDYMQLRYEIADDPLVEAAVADLSDGTVVVGLDERDVAHFARVHGGEPLAPGEALLRFRNRDGLWLGAESFFFQEGHASRYARPRYGELKVDEKGNSILVGLRGEDLEPLGRGENAPEE